MTFGASSRYWFKMTLSGRNQNDEKISFEDLDNFARVKWRSNLIRTSNHLWLSGTIANLIWFSNQILLDSTIWLFRMFPELISGYELWAAWKSGNYSSFLWWGWGSHWVWFLKSLICKIDMVIHSIWQCLDPIWAGNPIKLEWILKI